MRNPVMMEECLQFGEGGRLFGILTLPAVPARHALPVFVFLNAGALHRVGPARLHVHLARELARSGFTSLRVDLAGTGDSPPRPGLADRESVAADCQEIIDVLASRVGRASIVLGGLCSGADNAIRLAPETPQVVGMFLLDPHCFEDEGFALRQALLRYADPRRYLQWARRHWRSLRAGQGLGSKEEPFDYVAIRNLPTLQELRASFTSMQERGGRVLSVFTQYARPYYNQSGQLARVVKVDGYSRFATELFWPGVEHTFTLEVHRRRLIGTIGTWAGGFMAGDRAAAAAHESELDRVLDPTASLAARGCYTDRATVGASGS